MFIHVVTDLVSLRGYISKSSYLHDIFSVQAKIAFFSRRRIPFATLLYEKFIHLTKIPLRPNIQLLSNRQHAYQSLRVTSIPGLIPFAILRHAE